MSDHKRKIRLPSLRKLFLLLLAVILLNIGFLFISKPVQVSRIEKGCSGNNCIAKLSGEYENETVGIFLGEYVPVPAFLPENKVANNVLGETNPSNKKIYVDLTSQRLYAFEGNNLVYNFLISSGKWGKTPTGEFKIWIKLRYTRMSGGNKAIGTYYNLPNVPYTMYFYNDQISRSRGFALHGAYWHNNFGHPMSHGCVNIKPDEAGLLYDWAYPVTTGNTTYATSNNPGTTVIIYGVAPKE